MYRLGPNKKEIDLLGEFMEHNIGRKKGTKSEIKTDTLA